MPLRRSALELRVERDLPGPGGARERVGLSARFDGGSGSVEPTTEELREALAKLRQELDGVVGPVNPPTRSVEELVETYRPRQRELVALLEAEGEISAPEANLLLGHLARVAESGDGKPSEVPGPLDRPIAAAPLEVDRAPAVARPVAQLLTEYRIESLRQAGAVRARRQISYEEYMALKRHFSAPATGEPAASEPHPAHRG